MRLKLTNLLKFCCAVLLIALICILYYQLNNRSYAWYLRSNKKHLCITDEGDMKAMINLLQGIHSTLQKLNVTHFLIYGTLIGAIRYNKILPWDNDLDIGVQWKDITRYSNAEITLAFAKESINAKYWHQNGFYRLRKGNYARADLMIFDDYYNNGIMTRIGIESYFAWLHYRRYHSFPAKFLTMPLPTIKISGLNMSIPREGKTVMKLLYPDDYWKEVKPHGC